ncbi:MAG TPA: ABC transporter ATP-binding protein [Gammaproteobacteria bacterium]|nr:ABC transporter ATP-binding protein [Gammaproteobacteria bacterium]
MSNIRFLLGYILQHKLPFSVGVVFVFLTNWLAVSIPMYVQRCIDLLNPQLEGHYPELIHHIVIIFIMAFLMIFVRSLSRILFFNPGRAIEMALKNECFAKLNRLQREFHQGHPVGTLISIVNNDINGIRLMAGLGLMQIFNILFALSLTPVKMWQMSPSLTVYCVIPVLVVLVVVSKAMSWMRNLMRARMEELQGLSTRTVGFLAGIDVIKGNRIHDWAVRKFAHENGILHRRSVQLFKIRTFIFPMLGYIDKCLKVIILAVGGSYMIRQDLTIGEITAFLTYATLLSLPFISMGFMISIFQSGMAGLDSVRRILDQPLNAQDARHLPESERGRLFREGFAVRDLSFTYPGASEPVLKNINLEIRPGQRIGILGRIGSGKSTLVNCMNRYLEIAPGRIFIDDRDIAMLSRKDLRSVVRTLTQDPFLFSDAIAANVRFGAGGRERAFSLEETLRMSSIAGEVAHFPHQEQTVVGEKGILLSGGQKQRLSLARAMYTPCRLLILDNVLSAVDYETERFLLQQIFEKIRAGSILIVSDRVSVLERVDQVLVLDNGEIIARGTHEQLLRENEYYRQTAELQSHGRRDVA